MSFAFLHVGSETAKRQAKTISEESTKLVKYDDFSIEYFIFWRAIVVVPSNTVILSLQFI